MLQIQQPQNDVAKIMGIQEYQSEKKYRLINFAVSETIDDGVLLFNNLTKELCLLSNDEYDQLVAENFSVNNDFGKQLIEKWFLVPQDNDDYNLCEQVRQVLLMFEKTTAINYYTIIPTTGCNARCFYCFEAGTPVVTMNDKTAEATADFIIKNSNGCKVFISWFGGEPLCNYKAIDIICTKLKENNIDFDSRMVSNSYLFTEEMVKRARDLWKLQNVHVTLDGMHETYNKIKNYVNNDKNAFEHVVDNIELLMNNKILVIVRMNMGSYNIDELYTLVDYLAEKFAGNKYFHLYATTLYDGDEFNYERNTDADRVELAKNIAELLLYIKNKGIHGRDSTMKKLPIRFCQADQQNFALIVPDGHLGFCEHYLTDDFYGTIFEDAKPKPFWSDYRKPQKECFTCPVWPNCRILERCPVNGGVCYEYRRIAALAHIRDNAKIIYERYLRTQKG